MGHGLPNEVLAIAARPGSADVVGVTSFGLVISHDSGATWAWICEAAAGTQAPYIPDAVYAASGALYVTTYGGLVVSRDGCSFQPIPSLPAHFFPHLAIGSDGAIYAPSSDTGDFQIYKSTDDGHTFAAIAAPSASVDTWQSIAVAPSDPQRVYLSGYHLNGVNRPDLLLYRSDDAGAHWTQLDASFSPTSTASTVDIASVSPTDPDELIARVTYEVNFGDGLYRSTDGGAHWTHVLSPGDSTYVRYRSGTDVLVATPDHGAFRSSDGGATYTAQAAPTLRCLAAGPDGRTWGCPDPSDPAHAAIVATNDGSAWSTVLALPQITAPADCAPGTTQATCAEPATWCAIAEQLDAPSPICAIAVDGGVPIDPPPGGGCCSASGGDLPTALLLTLLLPHLLRRRS